MLRSHLNLIRSGSDTTEEAAEVETIDESVKEIPVRCLQKSQVCGRLRMKLTRIDAIRSFKNIMFLDVSNNCLDIQALQVIAELPYLILIHADDNKLSSAELKPMKYLQVIIFNNNQITSVADVHQEQLSTLELGFNKITKIDFKSKMNKIKTLAGIELLVNLRILHVRNNPIRYLDGFNEDQGKLQYINLRNCQVATLRQVKKMKVLKALDTLIMKGCPYMGGKGEEDAEKEEEDDPQIRVELLATLPRLKRINKDIVTPEEREESKMLMAHWVEEGEKEEEEIEDEQQQEEEMSQIEN
ncbi:hypothetical protein HW555_011613 [Spodoptera exigua]|uniref:Leucine-rich repeat-containing protein 23 n=1 Tax=Spodoptera exigua TaxID=7107 RepID=A0A835G528_SPOEX|nr:hypothetical protein HW555_011613 [Spodoptera exigua]